MLIPKKFGNHKKSKRRERPEKCEKFRLGWTSLKSLKILNTYSGILKFYVRNF